MDIRIQFHWSSRWRVFNAVHWPCWVLIVLGSSLQFVQLIQFEIQPAFFNQSADVLLHIHRDRHSCKQVKIKGRYTSNKSVISNTKNKAVVVYFYWRVSHLYSLPQLFYELLVNALHPLRVLLIQWTKCAGKSVKTVSESSVNKKNGVEFHFVWLKLLVESSISWQIEKNNYNNYSFD